MPFLHYHFILYIIGFIILLYLSLSCFLRIKMPFWRTQPVFHFYNLKYWWKPPGFISLKPPPVNKYVNLVNTKLINLSTEEEPERKTLIEKICKFIQDYYVIHPDAAYKPRQEDIMAYLESTNHPSYFNLYQEPTLLLANGTPSETLDDMLIGVISARVLNVTFLKKKGKKRIAFPVYYIDNLCVQPGYRKKGIPPQLIQTFHYSLSRQNPRVQAYMFKKEGKLNAIVPLVHYETHSFDIRAFQTEMILNPSMTLLSIGTQQLNVLISFIKEQMPKFDCVVLPDVSSVLNLLKLEKLLVFGILFGTELIAAYVFRPLELFYEGQKTVECVAIISNCKDSAVLVAGFNMSLLKVREKCQTNILLIEANAHSQPVIAALCSNTSAVRKFTSPTAFFLYNYASYSVNKDKILLIY
jgi:hypothetical protein